MDLSFVLAGTPDAPALSALGLRHEVLPPGELARARGEYVVTTSNPAAVSALWENRTEGEVVIASRYCRGGVSRMGPVGAALSRGTNRLLRRLLELPLHDLTSEHRLYRASALRQIGSSSSSSLERLVRLYNEGFKIKEIPFEDRGPGTTELPPGPAMLLRLRRLRFSKEASDADERAFNKKRQETIISYLEVDVPVLDVGCGSGRLIQTLAKGIGLDRDLKKLRYLRGRAPLLVGGDMSRLPFRDESLPQVVVDDVPEAVSSLPEIRRVLRPHGTLVFGSRLDLENEITENGFTIDERRRVPSAGVVLRAIRK